MITSIQNENVQLILSSEAEFPDFGPPKAAVEGMLGERGKQYCTETLSRYTESYFNEQQTNSTGQGEAGRATESTKPSL